MQKNIVVAMSLLAALYAGQVLAEEAAVADKKPVVSKKHKKDCVEHQGKPCHLHAHAAGAVVTDQPVSGVAAAPLATALVATVTVLPPVSPVSSAEGVALARSSGCLTCHSLTGTTGGVFGPNWNKVADHYRNDANAEAFLVNKIARGGSGVWGKNAMPPNSPRVNEADIHTLAKFVLNLPKAP